MYNKYHALLSITAAHDKLTSWQRLTNAENGSQPFSHESHRGPLADGLQPRFTIVHHDLQFGLQNKTKQN